MVVLQQASTTKCCFQKITVNLSPYTSNIGILGAIHLFFFFKGMLNKRPRTYRESVFSGTLPSRSMTGAGSAALGGEGTSGAGAAAGASAGAAAGDVTGAGAAYDSEKIVGTKNRNRDCINLKFKCVHLSV